jgi:hypothetical protein
MSKLNILIITIVGTAIAGLIVAYITGAWKPSFLTTTQPVTPPATTTQQEQTNGEDITNINIDNTLLASLYGQAVGLAMSKYDDAKLSEFGILVYPHRPLGTRTYVYFWFYSSWADRVCHYGCYDGQNVNKTPTLDQPAISDSDRATFSQPPWVNSPDWLGFIRKSYQKVGTLSSVDATYYDILAPADNAYWSLVFFDGISGKEYWFDWNGKGDPIQRQR